MAPEQDNSAQEAKHGSSGGCILKGCITCLVLLMLVGGYCTYKAKDWAREGAAFLMVHASETGIKSLELGSTEKEEEILVPIRELGEKIKTGEVSLAEGKAIATALMEGPVVHSLICKTAEAKYLTHSNLPQEEIETASLITNRFMQAMIADKVEDETIDEIKNIITVKVVGKEQPQFKDSLTEDEIRKVVAIMQQTADEAEISAERVEINIGEELRKAIDAGLNTANTEPEVEG